MAQNDKIDKRIRSVIYNSRHLRVVQESVKYDNGYEYDISVDHTNDMSIKIKTKKKRYDVNINFKSKGKSDVLLHNLMEKYNINKNYIIKETYTPQKYNIVFSDNIILTDDDSTLKDFIKVLDEFFETDSGSSELPVLYDKSKIDHQLQVTNRQSETSANADFVEKKRCKNSKRLKLEVDIDDDNNTKTVKAQINVKGRETKIEDVINIDEYQGADDPFKDINSTFGININNNTREEYDGKRIIDVPKDEYHVHEIDERTKKSLENIEKLNDFKRLNQASIKTPQLYSGKQGLQSQHVQPITKLKDLMESFIICPKCGRRRLKSLQYCPSCCEEQDTMNSMQTTSFVVNRQIPHVSRKLDIGQKTYDKSTTRDISIMVGSYEEYCITVPNDKNSCYLYGDFIVSGGTESDIEMFIVDEYSFVNWLNGVEIDMYYFSGRVTTGNINIQLPVGKYHIVYSNTFDTLSSKNVRTSMHIRCE